VTLGVQLSKKEGCITEMNYYYKRGVNLKTGGAPSSRNVLF